MELSAVSFLHSQHALGIPRHRKGRVCARKLDCTLVGAAKVVSSIHAACGGCKTYKRDGAVLLPFAGSKAGMYIPPQLLLQLKPSSHFYEVAVPFLTQGLHFEQSHPRHPCTPHLRVCSTRTQSGATLSDRQANARSRQAKALSTQRGPARSRMVIQPVRSTARSVRCLNSSTGG